jgi:hypothetical protein
MIQGNYRPLAEAFFPSLVWALYWCHLQHFLKNEFFPQNLTLQLNFSFSFKRNIALFSPNLTGAGCLEQ